MDRKKKLRIRQFFLLILGSLVIIFTYTNIQKKSETGIITQKDQAKIELQASDLTKGKDIFYNIEYTGLDFSGNRYILKSKEAVNEKTDPAIVLMKYVEAPFFFKDDTVLTVKSNNGKYNNKTLDMSFSNKVEAKYLDSELFAKKAEYSNSRSFLIISENVRVKDTRGTIVADKLLFDIKNQKLNIEAFKNNKINASVNLK